MEAPSSIAHTRQESNLVLTPQQAKAKVKEMVNLMVKLADAKKKKEAMMLIRRKRLTWLMRRRRKRLS
jgi:hypothetical protein